jgi:hypothetical protein
MLATDCCLLSTPVEGCQLSVVEDIFGIPCFFKHFQFHPSANLKDESRVVLSPQLLNQHPLYTPDIVVHFNVL